MNRNGCNSYIVHEISLTKHLHFKHILILHPSIIYTIYLLSYVSILLLSVCPCVSACSNVHYTLTNKFNYIVEAGLDVNQFGFRRSRSTEMALLTVMESPWTELGISGKALCRLRSYLSGRTFQVSWQGQVFSSHCLSGGVPQGSVLKPLLFSIYTMSLDSIIHSELSLSWLC